MSSEQIIHCSQGLICLCVVKIVLFSSSLSVLIREHAHHWVCSSESLLIREPAHQRACSSESVLIREYAHQRVCSSESMLIREYAHQRACSSEIMLIRERAHQRVCSSESIPTKSCSRSYSILRHVYYSFLSFPYLSYHFRSLGNGNVGSFGTFELLQQGSVKLEYCPSQEVVVYDERLWGGRRPRPQHLFDWRPLQEHKVRVGEQAVVEATYQLRNLALYVICSESWILKRVVEVKVDSLITHCRVNCLEPYCIKNSQQDSDSTSQHNSNKWLIWRSLETSQRRQSRFLE